MKIYNKMEAFNRINIGPSDYNPNTWTKLYSVDSTMTGTLIFDFSAVNITPLEGLPERTITISIKILDKDDKLINYIIPAQILSPKLSFNNPQKIVLKPGDKIMVQASALGICFYASIASGILVNNN